MCATYSYVSVFLSDNQGFEGPDPDWDRAEVGGSGEYAGQAAGG